MDGIKPYNVEFTIDWNYRLTHDDMARRMYDILDKAIR